MTSLQNMLQVRPATLDAHSGALCKVLDHSANLFLWNPSDLVSDGCLEFPECLGIVLVDTSLQEPPEVEIRGVQIRAVRCPLHSTSSAYQAIPKLVMQPGKCTVRCVGGGLVQLEPLLTCVNTNPPKGPPKLHQNFCDGETS